MNSAAQPAPAAKHPTEYTAEVRFGIVMYGGVSLAVYINGVSHEIFEMCCATPRDGAALAGGGGNGGTREIYERLSRLAGDPDCVRRYAERLGKRRLDDPSDVWESAGDAGDGRVRFVVDAIAGTSAGGINGIFLAKALVNGEQFSGLRDLWIKQGDIGSLLNDEKSWHGVRKPKGLIVDEPRSLLNSDRMYHKLLEALRGMQALPVSQATAGESPLVEELDLVLTTTDLRGTPVPLQLFDKVVYERRHKQRFAWKYPGPGSPGSDFAADQLPFLAFAARCTSSFPFAFEPMTLERVSALVPECGDAVLDGYRRYFDAFTPSPTTEHLRGLPFSDGGTLDNKPFSHVAEALSRRFGDPPGRRKLLYVEPDPDWLDPQHDGRRDIEPNAVSTAFDALLTIPMYETVREDLDAVLARNRRIERVEGLVYQAEAAIEADAQKRKNPFVKVQLVDGKVPAWRSLKGDTMVSYFGRAVLPYRQLRVFDTTDRLAEQLALAWGQDPQGDRFQALRGLVRRWRDAHFSDRAQEQAREPLNEFLYRFDFDYRVRRVAFILRRIDRLRARLRLPWSAHGTPESLDDTLRSSLLRHARATGLCGDGQEPDESACCAARVVLAHLKRALRLVYRDMLAWRDGTVALPREAGQAPEGLHATLDEVLRVEPSTWDKTPLERVAARLSALASDPGVISLQARVDAAIQARAIEEREDKSTEDRLPDGTRTAHRLTTEVWFLLGRPRLAAEGSPLVAQLQTKRALDGAGRLAADAAALVGADDGSCRWVLQLLGETFLMFDQFDQTRFPMYFGTDTGEPALIDVVRVSPVDAQSLVKEQRDTPAEERKLAGTGFAHFAAFLDERWRRNDAMWGRLDGAERLVAALLPPLDAASQRVHDELVSLAQRHILGETFATSNRAELTTLLLGALADVPGQGLRARLRALVDRLLMPRRASGHEPLLAFLETLIDERKLQEHLRTHHRLDLEPAPQATLDNAARAVSVLGKVLAGAAEGNAAGQQVSRWIARAGAVLNALVAVSVPGSLRQLWWTRVATTAYSLLFAFIVLSFVFGSQDLRTAATSAAVALLAAQVVTWIMRDQMRKMSTTKRWIAASAALGLTGFAALGVSGASQHGFKPMVCGPAPAASAPAASAASGTSSLLAWACRP
jgi:patatin-related protein